MDNRALQQIAQQYATPTYVYNLDDLKNRVEAVQRALPYAVSLCFAIKANPFLVAPMDNLCGHLEVCSPGELSLCERAGVPMEHVIFSGVNKTEDSILRAMENGVGVFTAESLLHLDLLESVAAKLAHNVPVLLRLTSGNQFGMSRKDLLLAVEQRGQYPHLEISGLHFYGGTQRKGPQLPLEELTTLAGVLEEMEQRGLGNLLLEYGPGLGVSYFEGEEKEEGVAWLEALVLALGEIAARWPVTLEMGRYLTAAAGTYLTAVMDLKSDGDAHYAILDGGINHLNYYGQTMAMKVPPVENITGDGGTLAPWMLCGSLCTTADVLVRRKEMPLALSDVLAFRLVGGYSVTEALVTFLSRRLPLVLTYSGAEGAKLLRPRLPSNAVTGPMPQGFTLKL